MTRKERYARKNHPRLYALGHHTTTQLLGRLFWTKKALKTARAYERATYRPRSSHRSYRHQQVVVHVYAGATINL